MLIQFISFCSGVSNALAKQSVPCWDPKEVSGIKKAWSNHIFAHWFTVVFRIERRHKHTHFVIFRRSLRRLSQKGGYFCNLVCHQTRSIHVHVHSNLRREVIIGTRTALYYQVSRLTDGWHFAQVVDWWRRRGHLIDKLSKKNQSQENLMSPTNQRGRWAGIILDWVRSRSARICSR